MHQKRPTGKYCGRVEPGRAASGECWDWWRMAIRVHHPIGASLSDVYPIDVTLHALCA
jgi:hypothetical protein